MTHADAELSRIDRAHLADALGQVSQLGSGRKSEPLDIAWPIQLVCGKRRDWTHDLSLHYLTDEESR